ncbi:MAG TPA: ParB/RepB/Spo0J family partition protein [Candidatus Limnocylindria bacterium]|nr:ParB/RepB/Spo0J family partition protein [Candidatus Limnocylindria bacterium]
MARTGLGRGLDVLLGQTQPPAAAAVAERPAASELPLERISPNPQQPRQHFDQAGLAALAASIQKHGVLQPIVVSRVGDGYELVAGHRRVLAARLAGRTTIPAVVREEVTDRLELALIENIQRADLNAIETARAYRLLMDAYGLTQEQLADRVGKSRSAVANTLRALAAPQLLQDAVTEGRISEGHLRALLSLPLSDAIAALGEVITKELSVREAEALARKLAKPRGVRSTRHGRRVDPDLADVTNALRSALQTKVHVERRGQRGRGRITIEFYTADDFQRLYERLVGGGA